MGPYCKFCNNRCFIPTDKGLRAQCIKGQNYDFLNDALKAINQNDKCDKAEKESIIKNLTDRINEMKKDWI